MRKVTKTNWRIEIDIPSYTRWVYSDRDEKEIRRIADNLIAEIQRHCDYIHECDSPVLYNDDEYFCSYCGEDWEDYWSEDPKSLFGKVPDCCLDAEYEVVSKAGFALCPTCFGRVEIGYSCPECLRGVVRPYPYVGKFSIYAVAHFPKGTNNG
jgi:hypothetical protein